MKIMIKILKILSDAKSDLIKCDRFFENIEILINLKNDLIMMRSNFLKILSDAKSNKNFHKLNNKDTKMYKYTFHKLNNKKYCDNLTTSFNYYKFNFRRNFENLFLTKNLIKSSIIC